MIQFKLIFWRALKAFVPLAVTIAVVIWLFQTIETFFGRLIKHVIPEQYYFDGLGILVGIAIIFLMGVLVNAWAIRRAYSLTDMLVKRIPLIKTIYNATQDLFNFFDKSKVEQQAVLVPTQLGKVVGFITRESLSDINPPLGNRDEVLVYIPLSYQIGGVMTVVPRASIIPLDWSVNAAMSFILTAGMMGQKK
jgi:uncharacterized membrane protein